MVQLGYSGHKHFVSEKIVAITDRKGNVIAPYTVAPGNRNECPLFTSALCSLKRIAHKAGISLKGAVMSLDGVYDSLTNRKAIFNSGMKPNIPENKRNRKKTKRGRKRIFSKEIFKERFYTVERAFSWEDKFKRLLIRFERKSSNHLGLKQLAYTMINLRNLV